MISLPGKIIRWEYKGVPVSFFVNNPDDEIQQHHNRGEFYEKDELAIIEQFFKPGDVYLDVGANIGNHLVYVGKCLMPAQMIVIEPNPPSLVILEANIDLNRLWRSVDLSLIGLGLSDDDHKAIAVIPGNNLGATRLERSNDENAIRVVRGDDVLGGRRIDFIKMDVEGMELKALAGMTNLIGFNRPTMFIEVETANEVEFNSFVRSIGYITKVKFKRYFQNENYLIIPAEKISD